MITMMMVKIIMVEIMTMMMMTMMMTMAIVEIILRNGSGFVVLVKEIGI